MVNVSVFLNTCKIFKKKSSVIDLQVYGVVTFTATIDNSLRNLKGGKEREREQ